MHQVLQKLFGAWDWCQAIQDDLAHMNCTDIGYTLNSTSSLKSWHPVLDKYMIEDIKTCLVLYLV